MQHHSKVTGRRLGCAPLFPFLVSACTSLPSATKNGWLTFSSPPAIGAVAFPFCWADAERLLVFGGYRDSDRFTPLNSRTAVFYKSKQRWDVLPAGPPPRQQAALASSGDHRLVLMGGQEAEQPFSNTTYALDLNTMQWQQLSGSEELSPRRRHSLVEVGTRLVVFGGVGRGEALNWGSYDSQQWTIYPPVDAGSGRVGHVAVALDHELFVWGGFVEGTRRGDGLLLEPVSGRVTHLPPTSLLGARANARAVAWDEKVLVWGGMPLSGEIGAIFDRKQLTWSAMPPLPGPGAADLKNPELLLLPKRGILLVGGRFASDAFHDQAYLYRFATERWEVWPLPSAAAGRMHFCLQRMGSGTIAIFGGIGGEVGSREGTLLDDLWLQDLPDP